MLEDRVKTKITLMLVVLFTGSTAVFFAFHDMWLPVLLETILFLVSLYFLDKTFSYG